MRGNIYAIYCSAAVFSLSFFPMFCIGKQFLVMINEMGFPTMPLLIGCAASLSVGYKKAMLFLPHTVMGKIKQDNAIKSWKNY